MRVKLAFWLAARTMNWTILLLDWGCRHSDPPRDLATEMAVELAQMAPVYVLSPEQSDQPVMTKH